MGKAAKGLKSFAEQPFNSAFGHNYSSTCKYAAKWRTTERTTPYRDGFAIIVSACRV